MENLTWLWDQISHWILHLDKHVVDIAQQFGVWTYVILFGIVFCETGLVITPFLPGDSLLFAVGAASSKEETGLNVWILWSTLFVAAVLGDTVNYHMGHFLGPRVLRSDKSRWLNRKHLVYTQKFFEKHGGKTIILGRFMPIIRTFAPFVAGVGSMHYSRFLFFNVVGGFIWVSLFVLGGHWFGQLEAVENNFSLVIVVVVCLSIIPVLFAWWQSRGEAHEPAAK